MLVACAACDTVLGLAKTVPSDGPSFVGQACDALPFDRLRYHALDMSTLATFNGLTTATALQVCQAIGMELVSFDDGDTMELANELSGAPFYYWTGLQFTGTGWSNPDGCRAPDVWRATEPSSNDTSSCGLMTSDNEIAAGCGEATFGAAGMLNALCETPRPSPACLSQWNPAATAYRVPDLGNSTYVVAAPKCNLPNEHVVVIDSSAELATVEAFAAGHGVTRFWVGATFSGTGWTTLTGCPAVFPWDYAGGQPDFVGGGGCTWIEGGSMAAHSCNNAAGESAQVICETD